MHAVWVLRAPAKLSVLDCVCLDLLSTMATAAANESVVASVFSDYTTALVLCPPEDDSKLIQTIRAELDKTHVDLWPAHVSLVYPFVARDELQHVLPAL